MPDNRPPGTGSRPCRSPDSCRPLTPRHSAARYGADFSGHRLKATPELIIPAVHLVGVALAVVAIWRAVRRFSGSDLMIQVLTAGMVGSLLAYTVLAWYSAPGVPHDLMPVLPIGAVLAGRLLTGDVIRRGLIPALAVALALYGVFLWRDAVIAKPSPVIAQRQQLATWLTQHHLSYGLSKLLRGEPAVGGQRRQHGRPGQPAQ